MYSYQDADENGAVNAGSVPPPEQPSRLQQFLAQAGSGAGRLQDPSLQDPGVAGARLYRPQMPDAGSFAAQTAPENNAALPAGRPSEAGGTSAPERLTLLRHAMAGRADMNTSNFAGPNAQAAQANPSPGSGAPATPPKPGTSGQSSRGVLDWLVDKVKGQPPAPELPATMKPPGAPPGAPGSSQYPLIKAQDEARADPKNQPKPNQGDTYCNIATYNTAKAMNAPMDPFITQVEPSKIYPKGVRPATANEMADNLASAAAAGKGYRVVTREEAQKLANQGKLVIATQPAPKHGHVATVRPDNLYNEPAPTEGEGPVISNVGRTVGVKRASGAPGQRAFSSDSEPIYYAPIEK
jgi:hypothetical protein